MPDGGEVVVTGERDSEYIVITITNPVAAGKQRSTDGNKMAMENIRQRFELAYDNRATVDVDDGNSTFSVKLRFPYEERNT